MAISIRLSIREERVLLKGEEKEREDERFTILKGEGCCRTVSVAGIGVWQDIFGRDSPYSQLKYVSYQDRLGAFTIHITHSCYASSLSIGTLWLCPFVTLHV